MKLLHLSIVAFFITIGSAQAQPLYCGFHSDIQDTMNSLTSENIDRLLPHAQWVDETYRNRDHMAAAGQVGKTIVLGILRRASWFGYAVTPTRVEAASFTAYYARNPENFLKFITLNKRQACMYLSMNDRQAGILRTLTRQLFTELHR